MSHPLHVAVGSFIQILKLDPQCRALLAPECGGSQNLPLFCSVRKGNDTEFCNVDIMIVQNGKIKLIIEIEESRLSPTKVCGKFLTSALSTHFIHDILNNTPTMMDSKVCFIQILDSEKLPQGTMKLRQGSELERCIQRILPLGSISQYYLFYFNGASGFQNDHAARAKLQTHIERFCKNGSLTTESLSVTTLA